MFTSDQYQLLDFGRGRRLERFGDVVLDRPCPAAENFQQAQPSLWAQADARFEGRAEERGQWTDRRELPTRWAIIHDGWRLELKRTDFGHLGIFPEQAENWDWIRQSVSMEKDLDGESPKVLNLFAYTGGSTVASAVAGAEVVHLDAAKNIVAWARRNAEISELGGAPIRWIHEDALKFVKRELRRGNHYNAVILDPPSYGHGAHGEVWRVSKHLPRLLAYCRELTADRLHFLLLTCHTPGYNADQLVEMLDEAGFSQSGSLEAKPLTIRTIEGRLLPCGVVVRWRRGIS
jgi:23S rRNA (cytosine1962-C5)-methyltransferase